MCSCKCSSGSPRPSKSSWPRAPITAAIPCTVKNSAGLRHHERRACPTKHTGIHDPLDASVPSIHSTGTCTWNIHSSASNSLDVWMTQVHLQAPTASDRSLLRCRASRIQRDRHLTGTGSHCCGHRHGSPTTRRAGNPATGEIFNVDWASTRHACSSWRLGGRRASWS